MHMWQVMWEPSFTVMAMGTSVLKRAVVFVSQAGKDQTALNLNVPKTAESRAAAYKGPVCAMKVFLEKTALLRPVLWTVGHMDNVSEACACAQMVSTVKTAHRKNA